ncbi:MAG: TRAP transporter small permease [Proteobacteria bacterium]|nr:TRAP transporter small permease [Pseudomonadota bacterium]
MSDLASGDVTAINPALQFLERWVSRAALWVGGTFVIVMMLLTVTDVTLRYVFNAPIIGARDYNSLALLIVVTFSVAYSARTGGQVAVEIFDNAFPPTVDFALRMLMHIAGAVMLVNLIYHLIIAGTEATLLGESTQELGINFEPFYYILALGMAFYVLILLAEIVEFVVVRRSGASGETQSL